MIYLVKNKGKCRLQKKKKERKKIPYTEEPGREQSMESQKVRHKLATKTLKTLQKEGAWLNSE